MKGTICDTAQVLIVSPTVLQPNIVTSADMASILENVCEDSDGTTSAATCDARGR